MPPAAPPALRVLARGLACRCPVCGRGRVFVRGVESARSCDVCGWRLERCVGHWIGGNEINVLAAFAAGVAAYAGAAFVLRLGLGPPSVAIATVTTGVVSVASYRPCRGLFLALDYLLDPAPDPASAPPSGDADRDRGRDSPAPAAPPRVPRGGARTRPSAPPRVPAARSSESFIPPPAAPYPPPATVSP